MVILKGPMLSIDARGQFAKTVVYSGWKGLKTGRQHVTPANPRTAGQVTQRATMTASVSAWKNYFTDAENREAWNRLALNDARPLSGFNSFTSNAQQLSAIDPESSMVDVLIELAANLLSFETLNMDDGVEGTEAGVFEIWSGATPSGMTLSETVALAAGDIIGTVDQGAAGDIVYCKVRKDGFDRSGIFRATLID